jgi:hypothetical protein
MKERLNSSMNMNVGIQDTVCSKITKRTPRYLQKI